MPRVSFDPRALTIDGQRTLLLSGAVHYPRSTPAMWPALMQRSKAAGLNTIETYVFWNLHERERGIYDFSDRLDLRRFITLAAEHGLHVILRIGPYICAETNYGGFPAWLRDVPGIAMRTDNEPFKREKARFVRDLCHMLADLFAPAGGPIIAAQIENEYDNVAKNYGDAAPRYLAWCNDLARELDLGVPWIMCLGHGGAGAVKGTIATINAFFGHQRLDQHFREHKGQPALWTENWPGWYDTWGYAHHLRDPRNVAYGVARFIAAGGTGVNYYMWHGGTNFNREAMYLQTTSYDFDAPLDEFGLTTTKSNHLAALHRILTGHADDLLGRDRPTPVTLDTDVLAFTYGPLTFLCNDRRDDDAAVSHKGKRYTIPAQSVSLVRAGKVLFNTHAVAANAVVKRRMPAVPRGLGAWSSFPEPLAIDAPDAAEVSVAAKSPIEQLQLTADQSDYASYTTTLTVRGGKPLTADLVLHGIADLATVMLDGQVVAATPAPPVEDRGPFSSKHFTQRFTLTVEPGRHLLTVITAAVGLIKGDWQIGQLNMAAERKGLFAKVTWRGKPLHDWVITPATFGERAGIPDGGDLLVDWSTATTRPAPFTWWRSRFTTPAGDDPVALDLTGMGKGLLWLNGRNAGRYWLCPADRPGVGQWQAHALRDDKLHQPTQRHYHLPRDWFVRSGLNTLVLLEETTAVPTRVRLLRRV